MQLPHFGAFSDKFPFVRTSCADKKVVMLFPDVPWEQFIGVETKQTVTLARCDL
ncbi:hypothetical protein ACVC7O_10635 [Roseobacter sp. A03A-229]